MPREELQTASEELRQASTAASDEAAQRRLYDLSDQFATLAAAENGPDHGRLARHLNALSELRDGAGEAVTAHIEAAEAAITAYRETVDGV